MGSDIKKPVEKVTEKVTAPVKKTVKKIEETVNKVSKGTEKQVKDVRDNTVNKVSDTLGKDAGKVLKTIIDVGVEQPLARTGKNLESITSDPFGAAMGIGLEASGLPTAVDAAGRAKYLLKPPSLGGGDVGDLAVPGKVGSKPEKDAPTNDNAEDAVDEDTGITDQTGDVSTSEEYMGQRSRNRKAKGRASTILAGGGAGELGQDSASAKRTLLGYA